MMLSREELAGRVRDALAADNEQAVKAVAVGIRVAALAANIEESRVVARRVLTQRQAPRGSTGIIFGKSIGLGAISPQIKVKLFFDDKGGRHAVDLLCGVTDDGTTYIQDDSPHIGRLSAIAEYDKKFPATITR